MSLMTPAVIDAVHRAAQALKVPTPNLLACIEVESNGVIFARIEQSDGETRDEPLIRWEGHYFDKRLGSNARAVARKRGLAHPQAGGIKNPNSQQARWDKLLWPAMAINDEAAIESVSWGVGQVMGAHWQRLGFASPQELMNRTREGAHGQIDVMLRYCAKFGLIDELQRGDFAGFARGYNGPNYKKYSYDTKMAKRAKAWAAELKGQPLTNVPARSAKAASMVRMGTEGAKVRQVQQLLKRAGYGIEVDGDFGPATKEAVKRFQEAQGLEVDGIVGPQTWQALEGLKVDPSEQPGVPGIAQAVVDTQEGRQGAVAVGSAVGIESVKATLSGASDSITSLVGTSSVINTVYTMLTVGTVLLTVGGLAWALYGWYRANSNRGIVTGEVEVPQTTSDEV
jgi:hypothetical protein